MLIKSCLLAKYIVRIKHISLVGVAIVSEEYFHDRNVYFAAGQIETDTCHFSVYILHAVECV